MAFIAVSIFESTRPVRARPGITHYMGVYEQISIHAPRAGATLFLLILSLRSCNFNPRAPCGRDLQETATCQWTKYFNPRAPCGRDSIQNYFTHFCDKRQFLDNFTQNAAF